MKATELHTSGFYINESKGLVREITAIGDDGQVEYLSYWLSDGAPDGIQGFCRKQTLAKWATREATPEEIAGLRCLEARQRIDDQQQQVLAQLTQAMPGATSDDPFEPFFPDGFTIRDEANALVAWAFRNGPLEDLHAGRHSDLLDDPTLSRITNEEMKHLMLNSCQQLAKLLELKATDSAEYVSQIKSYNVRYCRSWER